LKFLEVENTDLFLISPDIFEDNRGYFFESFNCSKYEKQLKQKINFVQDNESKSTIGVLRGLHYQIEPFSQSKLLRVIEGEIIDVVVDVRKNSPNFGKHWKFNISSENKRQLFIPKGYAHGFLTLSMNAIVSYKVDQYYSPTHERTIIWNDMFLDIDWGLDQSRVKVSSKDNSGAPFLDTLYL